MANNLADTKTTILTPQQRRQLSKASGQRASKQQRSVDVPVTKAWKKGRAAEINKASDTHYAQGIKSRKSASRASKSDSTKRFASLHKEKSKKSFKTARAKRMSVGMFGGSGGIGAHLKKDNDESFHRHILKVKRLKKSKGESWIVVANFSEACKKKSKSSSGKIIHSRSPGGGVPIPKYETMTTLRDMFSETERAQRVHKKYRAHMDKAFKPPYDGSKKWQGRASRIKKVLGKLGGKGGSAGSKGATTNLGNMYLASAGKTRKAIGKAKKKGRTEKHLNKLRMQHTANMNLSKSRHFNVKDRLKGAGKIGESLTIGDFFGEGDGKIPTAGRTASVRKASKDYRRYIRASARGYRKKAGSKMHSMSDIAKKGKKASMTTLRAQVWHNDRTKDRVGIRNAQRARLTTDAGALRRHGTAYGKSKAREILTKQARSRKAFKKVTKSESFIIVPDFLEAKDAGHDERRKGRLKAVRKTAFQSIRKANAMLPAKGHWDVPGGHQWNKTSKRMSNKIDKRVKHVQRASHAMSIYTKKRKTGGERSVDSGYEPHASSGRRKTSKYGGKGTPISRFGKVGVRRGEDKG